MFMTAAYAIHVKENGVWSWYIGPYHDFIKLYQSKEAASKKVDAIVAAGCAAEDVRVSLLALPGQKEHRPDWQAEAAHLREALPVPDEEGLRFGPDCWISLERLTPQEESTRKAFLGWLDTLRAINPQPEPCHICKGEAEAWKVCSRCAPQPE
jgi:hypothetical protein